MKPPRKRRLLLVLLPALAFAATLALPASAHTPAVYLEGAEQWTESDCEGETPIVVASDSRAQSDIYAAVMLAGVLETDCVILAGDRDKGVPAAQMRRFEASEGGGYIVGGTSAIPETKAQQFDGREMTRITGATRWNTIANVGRVASGNNLEALDSGSGNMNNETLNTAVTLSTGGLHSCGIRPNGTVECWEATLGYRDFGQSDAPSGTFTSVSAGWQHTCGIRTNETVECWGDDREGQSNAPSGTFAAVSAGREHSCGIRTNETVECWGIFSHSRLTDAPSGTFAAVSAGQEHSCGIRTNETVECWGVPPSNFDFGQSDAPSGTFAAVSAGGGHSCGIRPNGAVECWGSNSFGQSDAPSGTFAAVSAGGQNTCGIRTNETVECWGFDYTATASPPSGTFTAVSAGGGHSCGIRPNGTVECWGNNRLGQASPPSGVFASGRGD